MARAARLLHLGFSRFSRRLWRIPDIGSFVKPTALLAVVANVVVGQLQLHFASGGYVRVAGKCQF